MNKLVDDLWTRGADQCNADVHTDFQGLLSLMMRETIEGGDLFALRVCRQRSAVLVVPFQIELNAADCLDAAKWHKLKPDLFKKQLYHLPGCDMRAESGDCGNACAAQKPIMRLTA